MSTIGSQPNIQQNTYPADKRDTEKSNASSQKSNSAHAQSKAQGNTNAGQSQQLKEVFQLLLPLLEQLFQKFSSENPPNPELPTPTPAPSPTPTPTPAPMPTSVIVGTEGDDTLEGTYDADTLSGLAGNDRLFGRQGNDTLVGGLGNDNLYGGSGDDTLHGDAGNDYLSGGRGNNQLFGGEGDDVLASRLGSDILDGGQGNDTARIRGNIDNYSVQIGPPGIINGVRGGDPFPEYADSIILTNKETGQTVKALNIEQFRFNDASLSFDEMKQRAEPVNEPPSNNRLVELSSSQKDNLFSLFGREDGHGSNESVRVEDKDGNGKVSVGDIAVLAKGDASSVSQQFKTLTAEDVAKINGEPVEIPAELPLSDAQLSRITSALGSSVIEGSLKVTDEDNSGTLSAGDVIKGVVTPPGKDSHDFSRTLDANFAADLNGELGTVIHSSNEFSIPPNDTAKQVADLLNIGFPPPPDGPVTEPIGTTSGRPGISDNIAIFDVDASSKISEGDVLSVSNSDVYPSETIYHTMSADDIQILKDAGVVETETPADARLELQNGTLSPEQQNHFSPIVFSRIDLGTNLFDSLSISDSDNNGELSVGDVLEGNYFDGQIGQTVTHTVTQSDIDGYLNTTTEELNLSQRQHDAIRYHFDDASALAYDGQAVEYTGTAIDKDGDNKLSVGDTVKLRRYGYGMGGLYESFKDHTLTRDDVAAISDFSGKDTIGLSGAEKSQLKRAIISESTENLPGVSKTHIDSVIDKDGDGKLSVGDAIKTKITPNGGVASTEKTQFQTLTEAKLDRYNAGINYDSPRLEFELSANQDKTIRERFNIAEGVGNYYVLDADSNNQLSVGDQLAYFTDGTSNPFSGPDAPYLSHILTAEDIATINGETNSHDVKLEANEITVDGQSFTPKVPGSEIHPGTLFISPDNDNQAEEIKQFLESFASHGIEVDQEFSQLSSFTIKVPEQYTGHWAAALEAILPSQPSVFFNHVSYTD